MGLFELIANARYNRELYRSGRANKSIKQDATIGWQPDSSFVEAESLPTGERVFVRPTQPRVNPSTPTVYHNVDDMPPMGWTEGEYQAWLDEQRY